MDNFVDQENFGKNFDIYYQFFGAELCLPGKQGI